MTVDLEPLSAKKSLVRVNRDGRLSMAGPPGTASVEVRVRLLLRVGRRGSRAVLSSACSVGFAVASVIARITEGLRGVAGAA